ncbi:MAG: glycosyltransferase family 4 protein [Planctomycetes bacterium]|nr:glycosyltransferase family 4 protein [Planctomycetota bacterium]
MSDRTCILVFSDYYLPACNAGGPPRTLASMTDKLGDQFNFKIVTRDTDIGETGSLKEIKSDHWNRHGNADVLYLSQSNRTLPQIRHIINNTNHDILYLNSFFSPFFSILPVFLRNFRLVLQKPLILAPRGELSCAALKIKKMKKSAYIHIAKLFGLYNKIIWQASSEYEAKQIRDVFGQNLTIHKAPNLRNIFHGDQVIHIPPAIHVAPDMSHYQISNFACANRHHSKHKGILRIAFLSRISRIKNLDGALKILCCLQGNIEFDIYGPIEDKKYWDTCRHLIRQLAPNIKTQYKGSVLNNEVIKILSNYDLFFLPTHSENFGHAIVEALVAGCPVLISDKTPWRNLQSRKAGWDINLNHPEQFEDALRFHLNLDTEQHASWSRAAQRFGLKITQNKDIIEQNRQLFLNAINSTATK